MNGHTSDEMSCWVPQGSVLGPKRFLMFINDLVYTIQHDIVMFESLKKENTQQYVDLFKQNFLFVETWRLKNELTINIKKTKVQYVPQNHNTDCINFEKDVTCQIYNQGLAYVNTFKYLRADIDRNLNMNSFYDSMYNLVNHKLYLLKLIRPSLTVKATLTVGKSMIISLIDY